MSWKLTVGRLWEAWKAYPSERQALQKYPPGPPIFVTGTHRSGTTWVGQMLAQPGVWHVHEPFNPNKAVWKEAFSYAPIGVENNAVNEHIDWILKGGFRQALNSPHTEHPLMPLRLLPAPFHRVMIKDPLACLLTGYLQERMKWHTLILFRHPCGFASSVMRLKWPTGEYLKSFLQRPTLMRDHLEPFRLLMTKYADADSWESAAVLHGVLNRVLWNQSQAMGMWTVRFEDLCRDPLERFQQIFQRFQLPYDDTVKQRHIELCLGDDLPVEAYRTHAVARNSLAMAESWKKQVTQEETVRVREIWRHFGIPVYDTDEDWALTTSNGPQS